jgi:hypothetical protein
LLAEKEALEASVQAMSAGDQHDSHGHNVDAGDSTKIDSESEMDSASESGASSKVEYYAFQIVLPITIIFFLLSNLQFQY